MINCIINIRAIHLLEGTEKYLSNSSAFYKSMTFIFNFYIYFILFNKLAISIAETAHS